MVEDGGVGPWGFDPTTTERRGEHEDSEKGFREGFACTRAVVLLT